MDEVGLTDAVVAGYDVGGRREPNARRKAPRPCEGFGGFTAFTRGREIVLEPGPVREFWYTSFHQLDLARQLIDGNPDAVRAYLRHFWSHWSGPSYVVDDERIDHLVEV
jgi:hypothetical protein